MSIIEMQLKRKEAFENAKNFAKEHADSNGVLNEEDKKTYEAMEAEISKITDAIERERRAEDLERELSKPTSQRIVEKPTDLRDEDSNKNQKPKKVTATNEYKEAVLTALRTHGRKVSNVMSEGIDVSGGYLVPDELDKNIITKLEEENFFRKLAKIITTSGEYKFNVAANKPAAAWTDEGEAITFSDPTFGQVSLSAHKLVVAVKVTEELLADNEFNLQSYLEDEFAKALSNAEEDAFINGVGNGKPHGIFNADDGGMVAVTLPNTNIKFDDIFNLVYSLKRPYRKKAKFLMNDQTIAALRKLKDNNGAYIWQASVRDGEPDRLMGYPIITSAYCPTIQVGKPVIAFGDFSNYTIGERGQRTFQELKELYAENGMVAFVLKERVDGKLCNREAVQILNIAESNQQGNQDEDGE